jgi:hypothetical protein
MSSWGLTMVKLLGNIIFLICSAPSVCNTHLNIASIFNGNLVPQIQVLHGGLSSPGVYKFRNNDKEYVLRGSLRESAGNYVKGK